MLRRMECRLNFKNRPVTTRDLKGGAKQPPLATNRGSQEPATNRVNAAAATDRRQSQPGASSERRSGSNRALTTGKLRSPALSRLSYWGFRTKYRKAKYRIAKYRTQNIESKISKSQNIETAEYRSRKISNRKISNTQNIEIAKYRIAKYRMAKYRIRKISTDKISNAKYRTQNIERKISK